MAGAPPPLPSSRPKGAYVPPPLPSNRPKVAYVHPLPPTTPEPTQQDVNMKHSQQSPAIIGMDEQDAPPSSLGQKLQAALHGRMMNNLNDMSSKSNPPEPAKKDTLPTPIPKQRPEISHKPAQPTPVSRNRPLSYSSFGDLFGGSTNKQQPQMQPPSFSNTTSHTSSSSSSSSAFNQLDSLFGSSSSSSKSTQPTGTNITLTATSEQKKAAANYSWNVAKDASKNISAKDVFSVGSLFASSYSNNGQVSASQEQQAALGRISTQMGQSAAKNVTEKEIGHAANFATTNVVNNATANVEQSNQQKPSFDFLAQVMGSKGGGPPLQPTNQSARARPKPLQQNVPGQIGLPPPPSPTPRQKVAPQPQRVAPQPKSTNIVPPRAAPRAPPSKAKSKSENSLIDFDPFEPSKAGPPGLPKSKAQGPAGGRAKPTIIRPGNNSRSASPAVEQQQKKSKPPPRPVGGPPTKKQAPSRPNAVHGTRSAGSTPPRPSGLQPKRKAPPRPGSQKGKKNAPKIPGGGGGGATKKLPPRPGPGHPLFNQYMGSEPHAVALFDYQGQEGDELSFKTDDIIILVKRIDSDWLIGKCKNKEGMFPTQFVKIVKDLSENKEDDYDGPQAVALFGFVASAPDELTFEEGDTIKLLGTVGTVWFRGELKGKTGMFPSNHVEVIVPLPGDSPVDEDVNVISGPRCKAKFEYSSSSADDLTFNEGAIIKLTGRVGEEWLSGELNGQSGIFPAAFVEIIEDLPPSSNRALTPTTGNDVRAMFDFDGADNTELSFKDGDKIRVTAKVGADWLEGELNGKKGRFPATFVDRIPSGLQEAKDTATSGVDPHCVVSFDFEPANDDEIKLKAGEKVTLLERIGDDWLRGKIDSREGIFPRSFVDVVIDIPSAGATPSSAKALHDFDAEDADEVSFKAGDTIAITERVNDEWLMGTVNGRSGRFPAAFVELSS